MELVADFLINGLISTWLPWQKKCKKISGAWCYHEIKDSILLIKDEKTQTYFSNNKKF